MFKVRVLTFRCLHYTILVVEDEKKLCDMIVKSLHQAGYEVDTCNDGEEDKREFMTWSFK